MKLFLWIVTVAGALAHGVETQAQVIQLPPAFPPTWETVEYSLPILAIEDSTFLKTQDFLMQEHKFFFSRQGTVVNRYEEYNYCAVKIRAIDGGSEYTVVLNRFPGRKFKCTKGCFDHNGLTYIIMGDAPKGMFSKTGEMRHFRYRDYVHYYFYSQEDDDGVHWRYQIRNGRLYPEIPFVFQHPILTPERYGQIRKGLQTFRLVAPGKVGTIHPPKIEIATGRRRK